MDYTIYQCSHSIEAAVRRGPARAPLHRMLPLGTQYYRTVPLQGHARQRYEVATARVPSRLKHRSRGWNRGCRFVRHLAVSRSRMRDDAYARLPNSRERALVVCCYAEAPEWEGLRVGARMV